MPAFRLIFNWSLPHRPRCKANLVLAAFGLRLPNLHILELSFLCQQLRKIGSSLLQLSALVPLQTDLLCQVLHFNVDLRSAPRLRIVDCGHRSRVRACRLRPVREISPAVCQRARFVQVLFERIIHFVVVIDKSLLVCIREQSFVQFSCVLRVLEPCWNKRFLIRLFAVVWIVRSLLDNFAQLVSSASMRGPSSALGLRLDGPDLLAEVARVVFESTVLAVAVEPERAIPASDFVLAELSFVL